MDAFARTETATLGGGCFWCLEAVYELMEGVVTVESGYMGGHVDDPTYQDVCSGRTGHAEVVQVTFDPATVSYRDILEVFFAVHDPTTLNRQGDDMGTQYRSAIFFHSPEQEAAARRAIQELDAAAVRADPVVTEVVAATTFYRAEDYHQHYFQNNGRQPYCAFVVAPKVEKFRRQFRAMARAI